MYKILQRTSLFLIVIVVLGVILRFYALGFFPYGLHRDEAFLGYNAYSILKTAKDISGNTLPLHLASFLYSPAGYSYFSIPFIALFDLNAFSVRLASAFFGSASIIVFYLFVKQILRINKHKEKIALLSAFFLAASFWHINLSRTATENTIVLFFILVAVVFYISWCRNKKFLSLILSFLSFGVTYFLYQAPRAFLPLFIPMLVLVFLPLSGKNKLIQVLILYFFLILIPVVMIILSPTLSLRIRTVSLFASQETKLSLDEMIREDGVSGGLRFVTRAFHNKLSGYFSQFLENYFKHFSYDFLFTDKGFPDRYRVPLSGLVQVWQLPLFLLGIWRTLQREKREGIFLISWIALVPLGSSLTFDDVPNLQRTLLMLPPILLFCGYGLIDLLSRGKIYKIISIAFMIIFVYNFLFYIHQYYIHGLRYRPWYRHDGYKDLVESVNHLLPNFERAVITDRESAPTIFFLFFGKYNPSSFQKYAQTSVLRDFDRISFEKYEFSQEECPLSPVILKKVLTSKIPEKKTLYVNSGLCKEILDATLISEIKRKDNSVVFRIYKVDKGYPNLK